MYDLAFTRQPDPYLDRLSSPAAASVQLAPVHLSNASAVPTSAVVAPPSAVVAPPSAVAVPITAPARTGPHTARAEEICAKYGVVPSEGLSADAVIRSRQTHGRNVMTPPASDSLPVKFIKSVCHVALLPHSLT
jgi:hypothetical protein